MRPPAAVEIDFQVEGTAAQTRALLRRPPDAWLLYVIAHGAGAGMIHPFLESISEALAQQGIATFRYQFPYMEAGRRRPDPPHLLQATVRSAARAAGHAATDLTLVAGGKSLGGRMTSMAASEEPLTGVKGLVFLGFPLHAPGKPGETRAEHLDEIPLPMLFLQGTRDSFADLGLLGSVSDRLGSRAEVHVVEGGDHSFKVPKRSGRDPQEVIDELAAAIADWGREAVRL